MNQEQCRSCPYAYARYHSRYRRRNGPTTTLSTVHFDEGSDKTSNGVEQARLKLGPHVDLRIPADGLCHLQESSIDQPHKVLLPLPPQPAHSRRTANAVDRR